MENAMVVLVLSTQKYMFSKCLLRHDVVRVFNVVPCVSFCTGHFVMLRLNMTYLYCLQHYLFEQLFNIYCNWKGLNGALFVAMKK